jgi:hypothetical protein
MRGVLAEKALRRRRLPTAGNRGILHFGANELRTHKSDHQDRQNSGEPCPMKL